MKMEYFSVMVSKITSAHGNLMRISDVYVIHPSGLFSRRCMTELESDVVVEVGDMSFYLHKVSTIECVAVTFFRIHQLNRIKPIDCAC